jgi:DNA-binding LacI/PurR family transcriptional regulator
MARRKFRSGPDSSRVARELRSAIGSGRFAAGQFLPCTRDLGRKHEVSAETVRRALKTLEVEGLIAAEPRHGFQVLRRPEKGQAPAVAYVLAEWDPEKPHAFSAIVFAAFQRAATRSGLTLLGVGDSGGDPGPLVEQLRKAEAGGIVLDTPNPALFDAVGKLGLPMVVAENWSPAGTVDAVIQDNFSGALQAAEHLAARGHRRIGWAGPAIESIQAVERWGGATAGLRRHGLEIPPELVARDVSMRNIEAAQALLARRNRPTAVIALWANVAIATARAAADLGLRLGRDLELVGWATEEEFETYAHSFPDGRAPATVTWRIETLAEMALARLAERRANPHLPLARINIETRLRPADALPEVPGEVSESGRV